MKLEELKNRIENYLNVFINEKINLKEYAIKNNIPIYVGKNIDKGWKGNVIEHILNLKKNNKKGSDYNELEIKTVPVTINNDIKIKETTCLSVLDPKELINTTFENSSLYKKIQNTLFILIDVENQESPKIVKTYYLDLEKNITLKNNIKNDYDILVNHIFDNIENNKELDHNFTGRLGSFIQPRPKTGKKGNYTWAFYLKTHVLTNLLKENNLTNNENNSYILKTNRL